MTDVTTMMKVEAGVHKKRKRRARFVIFVGGLGDSEESQQFIDFVTQKNAKLGLRQGSSGEQRAAVPSREFLYNCSWAYLLKLPCLYDGASIDGRMLAKIAIDIKNIAGDVEVSSFFYLVNDSQIPRTQAHQLHLQLWGRIFQAPPEPEASKFLVASSTRDGSLDTLYPIWQKHISGTQEAVVLSSHEEAEVSVRKMIALSSQMAVRLRTELLQSVPLRKTTVGRHYVEILEGHIKALESGQGPGWKVWKKPDDPDGSLRELKTELRHWKKCKLPQSCKSCLLIE